MTPMHHVDEETQRLSMERAALINEFVQAAALQSARALEALLRAALAERVGRDVRPEDIAARLAQTYSHAGRMTTYHLDDSPILETWPPALEAFNLFAAPKMQEVAFHYRRFHADLESLPK